VDGYTILPLSLLMIPVVLLLQVLVSVPTAACTTASVDGYIMLPLSLLMTFRVLLLRHYSLSGWLYNAAAELVDDIRGVAAAGPQFVSESSARRRQRQPTCKTAAPRSSRQTWYCARALSASVADSTRSAAPTEEAIAAAHPAAMAAELTPSGALAAGAMLSRGQQVAVLGGGGVSHAPNVNQILCVRSSSTRRPNETGRTLWQLRHTWRWALSFELCFVLFPIVPWGVMRVLDYYRLSEFAGKAASIDMICLKVTGFRIWMSIACSGLQGLVICMSANSL
jgi:hypothetical protein